MAFTPSLGPCSLCGNVTELTFEHTPPRSAFNEWPILVAKFDEWESGYGSEYSQRGRGGAVLCGRCNHFTGGAYGAAFAAWAKQGFDRLHQVRGRPTLNFHGVIEPLRVLKQIATIFFATSGPAFRTRHPGLQRFVLTPEKKGLSPAYQFSVFWYGGGALRQSGVAGVLNSESGSLHVLAEFVHPPFGYVLSLSGRPTDRRPETISDFATYDLHEAITLNRRFPVLETHWMMPGDYRTLRDIRHTELVNLLLERGHYNAEELAEEFEQRFGG